MKTMYRYRRAFYWRCLGAADIATDLAFSRKEHWWVKVWVGIANALDRAALWIAPPGMMDEKAKAA